MEHLEGSTNQFFISVLNELGECYYKPLHKYLTEHPKLIKTFPAFLLNYDRIVMFLGKTHLAIEYYGKETTDILPIERIVPLGCYDYSLSTNNFFEDVVGFNFDSTVKGYKMPLPEFSEDLLFPTNRGFDKLLELKWNFDAQNFIMGMNSPGFNVPEGVFCRIVNGRFFDADDNGLKTRYIKWMDFLPLTLVSETENNSTFSISLKKISSLVVNDASFVYPLPIKKDFKYSKLPQINRFLELIGVNDTSETELTSFLERTENKFILTMGLSRTRIFSQIKCEWQTEQRDAIKPDFFLAHANGFADIVEFKLPKMKGRSSVGKSNRKTFSAELHSYIAQTRVYRNYFEDPRNREWLLVTHGIAVRYPKRILIVGRRWEFSNNDWKEIVEEFRDLEILTYDDLVDTVVAQFYM